MEELIYSELQALNMSGEDFHSKVLKAILTGHEKSEVMKEIYQNEISLPFDLLKLGYETSNWRVTWDDRAKSYKQRQEPQGHKRQDWIHFLAYNNDSESLDFVKEIFFSESYQKGDCLLVWWSKNPNEAINWLEMIQTYDPLLKSLSLLDSPFVKKLCTKYNCPVNEIFYTILLKDDEARQKLRDKAFKKILKTEAKYRAEIKEASHTDKVKLSNEAREVNEKRNYWIAGDGLSQKQTDQLFEALWESNVELKDPPKELIDRDITKVIVCYHMEDSGMSFSYTFEVRQLLELVTKVSSKFNKKIETLFDSLPFWQQRFSKIEEAMYVINPKKVEDSWKEVLTKDIELGNPKRIPEIFWRNYGKPSFGRIQPTASEIIMGLSRIDPSKDKDFLISLMNHYEESVRKNIQQLMKEAVS